MRPRVPGDGRGAPRRPGDRRGDARRRTGARQPDGRSPGGKHGRGRVLPRRRDRLLRTRARSRSPGQPKTPGPNAAPQQDSGRETMSSPWLPARAASANRRPPAISRSASWRLGLKVGVLDADIYGPSMPKLFGLSGKPKAGPDRKIIPLENYGLKVMSIGFMVDEETPMIWPPRPHGHGPRLPRCCGR